MVYKVLASETAPSVSVIMLLSEPYITYTCLHRSRYVGAQRTRVVGLTTVASLMSCR